MPDLKDKRLIYLKAFLFLVIILSSAILLILQSQSWQTVTLIIALIWASARLYYFMFYVIERYVDPNYKFSSVYSFLKYLLSRKGGDKE